MRSLLRLHFRFVLALVVVIVLAPSRAAAQPPPDDPRFAEAKAHFLRGVEHSDRGEWDAALVEFSKSREILPTAKNTYNAAVALRRVNRYDEALDMYEALLRDFADLGAEERQTAQRELAQLKASVGAIELRGGVAGATVVIDARERGQLPLSGPLRLGAGTHTIKVSKEGYVAFEKQIQLAGLQTLAVTVEMAVLAAGGRLKVTEQTGKALDVVVDNAVLGKTPFDGVLAPGEHTVVLRGEGKIGTQPVRSAVKLNQTVTLSLLAEELDASLRVKPTPPTATVSVDGVVVGRGIWEGRLRAGTHTIEATADGYLAFKRDVTLKDVNEVVEATLARDPAAFAEPSASLGVELDVSGPLGVVFGGDVSSACSGSCSASIPFGVRGVLHGIYQAGSGFGFGFDVGYLLMFRSLTDRPESIQPNGNVPPNLGTVDDKLRLSGLTAGASGQYRRGADWPFLLRLGGGVVFGSVSDERSGTLRNTRMGELYNVSTQKSASATYLYVAPEVRIGRRFGSHFEINAGVEVLLMVALSQPKWEDGKQINTFNPPAVQGDGAGTFGQDTLLGSLVVVASPGVGARYDF